MDEGTKMVKLTDLLTEEQLDKVEKILNECHGNREQATKDLRSYLCHFDAELQAKGAHYAFLAYVIAYRQWTGGDNGDRCVPSNN